MLRRLPSTEEAGSCARWCVSCVSACQHCGLLCIAVITTMYGSGSMQKGLRRSTHRRGLGKDLPSKLWLEHMTRGLGQGRCDTCIIINTIQTHEVLASEGVHAHCKEPSCRLQRAAQPGIQCFQYSEHPQQSSYLVKHMHCLKSNREIVCHWPAVQGRALAASQGRQKKNSWSALAVLCDSSRCCTWTLSFLPCLTLRITRRLVWLSRTPQHSEMKGLMMQDSLLVTRILDYAARWHSEQVDEACTTSHCPLVLLQLCTVPDISNLRLCMRAGGGVPHDRGPHRVQHLGRRAPARAPVLAGAAEVGCAVRHSHCETSCQSQ